MISYLPDKFAGKAYKFVEIDHQVLENKGLKKPFHVMKPLLDQKTSKLPCLHLAQRHSRHLPISVFVICVF